MINGESVSTLGGTFKQALFETAQSVFAAATTTDFPTPPTVCMGVPSNTDNFQIVSIGEVSIAQEPAALGTTRQREETLTCDVTISVFLGGMDDVEPTVNQRAWDLMALLEEQVHYVRENQDGTTLGGLVRECFLTQVAQDSQAAQVSTTTGREAVIVGTFTAKARIRWQ
jgi:hypothetical protein